MNPSQTLSWTLIDDTDDDLPTEITYASDERSSQRWRVSLRTLHGGKREGVQVVEVDNGQMTLVIVPTRGMSLWKAFSNSADGQRHELGWRSPVRGPVHPAFVPLHDPDGLGWLEGFDELLVRCGLENNGPPVFNEHGALALPLHGRIGNLPAHHVTASVDLQSKTISVSGLVDETRFHFQKLQLSATVTIPFGTTSFTIDDVITNRSASPAKCQLLYHLNIGEPILDAGSTLEVSASQVLHQKLGSRLPDNWASLPEAQADRPEDVYYISNTPDHNGIATVKLTNSLRTQAVVVSYPTKTLPCFSYWKNTPGSNDGYVVGLEPGTGYPNPRAVEAEAGRIVQLASGATYETSLAVDWQMT